MKNIKILVATHKKYQMPTDLMYFPIQVGSEGKEKIGYQPDNIGDNISFKNPNYCELTGLYWAWKNLDYDYLGLSHYRRHFSIKKNKDKFHAVLTKKELEHILENYDAILPKKRKYYIETVYSHYANTHYESDLIKTKEIICKLYPNYLESFEKVMDKREAHIYNMFIMKKNLVDKYCDFLFRVLFELEKELDISSYDKYQSRIFGFLSERLLDVWIDANSIQYIELPVIPMEKINWNKKILSFLKAKFLKKRYTGGF